MIRALTRRGSTGELYERPAAIEAVIRQALQQDLPTLQRRARIYDRGDPDWLPSEVLVYLVRNAMRNGDEQTRDLLLCALFERCEAAFRRALRDMPHADALCDDLLGQLGVLFAEDSQGDRDELDFFEVRFNSALRVLRLRACRTEERHQGRFEEVPRRDEDEGAEESLTRAANPLFLPHATQLDRVLHGRLLTAIEALPPDDRRACVLVHMLGFKQESDDPNETTAATLCGVTGRTIRNRLTRAVDALRSMLEEG